MESTLTKIVRYAPPLAAVLFLRRRLPALGIALGGLLMVSAYADWVDQDRVHQARSFFGVLRVSRDEDEHGYVELRHGTTLHGRQSRNPARRAEPVSYYHREGPIGQLLADLQQRRISLRVAVIGLGTGAIAAYARPGDVIVYYEIDRLVRDIAIDLGHFTYIPDARARGATVEVEMGDARVRLDQFRRERPTERYDVIVVDAFSSDAIPVHLLTREALRLYLDVLTPGGIVALHISNRHLRLEPVVARLAADASLGGRLLQHDEAEAEGADRSTWALLSPTAKALETLSTDRRWTEARLDVEPGVGTWTDDAHDLLSVLKW
jgi:spermidine synthase